MNIGDRVAVGYVRVSSTSQTDAMQRATIERAAAARGDELADWYADRVTGGTLERPELVRLRADVRLGRVRRLYVYRLDRLTRTGIRDTLDLVEEFERGGAELVTIGDGFDFAGPARDIVLACMAWAAKAERQAINERIAAARAREGTWGRPRRLSLEQVEHLRELAAGGLSVRAIALQLGLPRSTVADELQRQSERANGEGCPEKFPRSPPENH